MKYLIDTDILIYLCSSKSKKLEKRFKRYNPDQFGISSITIGELIYGVNKSQEKGNNLQAILKILSPFIVLDFTSKDGWVYGEIRAELEAKGQIIGGNDLLISAQAKNRNLIVITDNVKEYKRIAGLKVENWAI